jgi:hypothetical protein
VSISGSHFSIESATGAFERSMLERTRLLVEESIATQNLMFAADAPMQLVTLINGKCRSEYRTVETAATTVPSRPYNGRSQYLRDWPIWIR